jgi:hypothetical protein
MYNANMLSVGGVAGVVGMVVCVVGLGVEWGGQHVLPQQG